MPKFARHLKAKLEEVSKGEQWITAPLTEIMDRATDSTTTKLAEGETEIAPERQDCTEIATEWEIEKQKKAYQSHLLNLQNQGEVLSKRDVQQRLGLVEKLIKSKHHRANVSMDVGAIDDVIGKEVSQFLNMSTLNDTDYKDPIEMPNPRYRPAQKRKRTVDDEETFKQAKEFAEKMEQERLLKKKKEAEKRKKMRQKMKEQEAQLAKEQAEREAEKEKERKAKLEELKRKEEERKKAIKDAENFYKENLKQIEKPLYKKIEKEFEKNYVIPELEKRKKELAEKRNFVKPIDRSELDEHAQKYEEIRKQEMAKRQMKYNDSSDYDPSVYKTKFLDSVLDYDSQNKAQEAKKNEEIAELQKKKKNYAKLVLETHKPRVSKRKKMEMDLIKQNLQNPTAFERIKKRMVSSSQNKITPYKNLKPSSTIDDRDNLSSVRKPKYKDFDWREKNRFMEVPKPPKEFKKIDYLTDMRTKKNNKDETRSENRGYHNWDEELSKYEGDDKIYHMKEKARMLEQEALKKEQLMKVHQGGDNTADRNQVNDMIIDSIKAKIALLDNIE